MERAIKVLGLDQIGDEVIRDLRRGCVGRSGAVLFLPGLEVLRREIGVVVAEGLELGGNPAPALEHLTGRFSEVAHSPGAVEAGIGGSGDEVVDAMAELVEEGDDFIVAEEAGFLGRGFGEVADEGDGGIVARAVLGHEAGLDSEFGCVAEFALSGEEVEIEVAHEAAALAFVVPHAKDLDLVIPNNVAAFAGW